MTFVCHTAAPSYLYLSEQAMRVLEEGGRILDEDEVGLFVMIHGKKVAVKESPFQNGVNITELLILEYMRLCIRQEEFTFEVEHEFF